MTTEIVPHQIESIGAVAGLVWNYIRDHGPVTQSKLSREIDAPRDLVMQSVGWLAREEKIAVEQEGRKKIVTLV